MFQQGDIAPNLTHFSTTEDVGVKEAKKKNYVIKNLLVLEGEKETKVADISMISSLINHTGISKKKVLEMKRHRAQRKAGLQNYARSSKILTKSETDRNPMMDCLSEYSRMYLPQESHHVRTDLT